MIFTTVSYIGDHILTWPVASWLYKQTDEKIHWVVTKNYYMYEVIKPFLEAQPFTERVSLVDVGTDAHDVNQWQFDPGDYTDDKSEYYNFGFNNYHMGDGEYIPKHYVKDNNLEVDYNFIPHLSSETFVEGANRIRRNNDYSRVVTMEIAHQQERWDLWKEKMPPDITVLSTSNNYATNVLNGLIAEERWLGGSSFSIIMDLYNKPCNIFCQPELVPSSIYRNLDIHTYHEG